TAPLVERAAGVLVNSNAARRALLLDLAPMAWRPPLEVVPPACPPVRPAGTPSVAADTETVVAFGVVSMGKRPDLLVDAAALAGCRLAFVGPCPEVLEQLVMERATARGIADRVQVAGRVDDEAWWDWMERATLAVQLRDSAGGEMSAAVLDALAAGVPVVTNLASARDYPPGTLELIEDAAPTAPVLAAAIGRLLGPDNQPRRRSLSTAGRDFAAAHQTEHLAAAVAAVLARPPE
ncbi:MAG TPA: glycosyltransferase, partial [Acidimicrobiales bacterium]|nr:glycosyltransferase [Acidimicrobiales bacterium]